ncbi:protein downstream neighbor of son homolog [Phlebotomus argentipes]|uniref:protein downstream neighbor of son homolog n=1 Tax=Phlebotomus argentipes TaxID=94469 RepID=UPI002892A67E|nr:protein downstream neighbor of son homolog [Phlebotomus argentipes]
MSGLAPLNAEWKHPDELVKILRLKQKQKALQARIKKQELDQPTSSPKLSIQDKRKNPFAVCSQSVAKKAKSEVVEEDTLFQLLHNSEIPKASNANLEAPLESKNFLDNAQWYSEEEEPLEKLYKYLPVDWSIKTRLRLLTPKPILAGNLKTSQEASGLTSFIRGIDPATTSTGLDISPGALFHQSTLYWQHPHLPWLTLYPRTARQDSSCNPLGSTEINALSRQWTESFRSVFQLLRARQCPYFYLCANSFTVLFRAAGIGGCPELHAIITPSSRGMRAALRHEEIVFRQPLKSKANETPEKPPADSIGGFEEVKEEPSDDDMDEEEWLENLGVDASEIKKISLRSAQRQQKKECESDFGDQSALLIEGAECAALFNYLLNCKSIVTNVGRLAGIPPTLLSPVAFLGATLRGLQVRSSKVRLEETNYHSVELSGVLLPHVLPYLSNLLHSATEDNFSATMANNLSSLAFTKVSQALIQDILEDKDKKQASDQVFGQENLSDCGLNAAILQAMCRVDAEAVKVMDRMSFNRESSSFTLS